MKTITMAIDALGVVTADDLKLGRIGEHKNTRLLITLESEFGQGIDYYRMSFGGFETAELIPENGILSYDVPSAATGSTVKSWQLTGYKAGEAEPELVRKSQMCIFTLEPSVPGDERLTEQYCESIENDIIRARATLAQAENLCEDFTAQIQTQCEQITAQIEEIPNKFVLRETGMGLSANDYTDTDKSAVTGWLSQLPKLEQTRGYPAIDAQLSNGVSTFRTKDGSQTYITSVGLGKYANFLLEVDFTGYHTMDVYYISFEDRALYVRTSWETQVITCPGNRIDDNNTIKKVSVQVYLQAGVNHITLLNPDADTPNLVRIEIAGEDCLLSHEDRAVLEEYGERLDKIEGSVRENIINVLKGTAGGLNVVGMDDVSPVEHKPSIKVASQNLIPYPYAMTTKTENGITFTDNADGTITVNGTATATTTFRLSSINPSVPLEKNTNYILSGCPAGGSGSTYRVCLQNANYDKIYSDNGDGVAVNSGADSWYAFIRIYSGATVENLVFKPQIEYGSTATEFTQYVNPTSVKIRRTGKNLLPYPYYNTTKTTAGITFTDNGDGSVTANGTATGSAIFYFWVNENIGLPDGVYSLSGNPNSQGSLFVRGYYTATQLGIGTDTGSGSANCAVTGHRSDGITVWYRIDSGTTVENLVIKPQLEFGAAITEYEQPKAVKEYVPKADGTVDGVTSVYPIMTLMSDADGVTIDCEYNRDINKAFAELQNAIISLGGNV